MPLDSEEWKYRLLKLREWWENLPARHWVNTHPQIVLGAATASFVLLLIIIVSLLVGGEKADTADQARSAWFYDLNVGKLFPAGASKVPPIKAPSGPLPDGSPAGVRAYVFTYGVDDESEPTIAYLETLAPDADASAYEKARTAFGADWGRGILVKRVDDADWTPADSPKGRAIIERAYRPDKDGHLPQIHTP